METMRFLKYEREICCCGWGFRMESSVRHGSGCCPDVQTDLGNTHVRLALLGTIAADKYSWLWGACAFPTPISEQLSLPDLSVNTFEVDVFFLPSPPHALLFDQYSPASAACRQHIFYEHFLLCPRAEIRCKTIRSGVISGAVWVRALRTQPLRCAEGACHWLSGLLNQQQKQFLSFSWKQRKSAAMVNPKRTREIYFPVIFIKLVFQSRWRKSGHKK